MVIARENWRDELIGEAVFVVVVVKVRGGEVWYKKFLVMDKHGRHDS